MKITFSISIAPDFMDLAFLFRQLAAGLPLGIGIAIKTPKGKKTLYLVCSRDVLAHLRWAALFITNCVFCVPILGYRTTQEYVRGAKYQLKVPTKFQKYDRVQIIVTAALIPFHPPV
ncbi:MULTISPECIES: hypothetical protein [Aeromonas]|uniref:hypothetical protein n=1 Tax=Aeromonas TaxID=642 RepID=UPI001C219738|nr:hypothetical protein [Aeromonas sp. FDAARGOS 1407]QXC35777.1 hypothetical protein I6L37_09135 [Aeromonas sp. FDAARGOS 1407]